MASKTKPKGGYQASDWPAEGDVSESGFCRSCRSFWCPHANPGLYDPKQRVKAKPARALAFRGLAADDLAKCRREAGRREAQKGGYASTRGWAEGGSTHLPGLVGELVYGRIIGQEPDWTLRAAGDSGSDFKKVDVKCSTFYHDPDLKIPEGDLADIKVPFLALVAWNREAGTAAYCGWATLEEMQAAELKNYGYGPSYFINWRALHEGPCPV